MKALAFQGDRSDEAIAATLHRFGFEPEDSDDLADFTYLRRTFCTDVPSSCILGSAWRPPMTTF
eukprot:1735267-Lingulodinium_polyedra.AAC.1